MPRELGHPRGDDWTARPRLGASIPCRALTRQSRELPISGYFRPPDVPSVTVLFHVKRAARVDSETESGGQACRPEALIARPGNQAISHSRQYRPAGHDPRPGLRVVAGW
jgi:hypothetical protein